MRAALLMVALLASTVPPTNSTRAAQYPEPYVLRWYSSPEHPRPADQRVEFGLVYTPDMLWALAARHPAGAVSPRIARAIRERTPIVVMWEFLPGRHDTPAARRPYRLYILEQWHDRQKPFLPLWIQQDAAGLQELDPRLASPAEGPLRGAGIAVMAAFPVETFVPGRIVHLESQPVQLENGMWTSTNVYTGIDLPLAAALRR